MRTWHVAQLPDLRVLARTRLLCSCSASCLRATSSWLCTSTCPRPCRRPRASASRSGPPQCWAPWRATRCARVRGVCLGSQGSQGSQAVGPRRKGGGRGTAGAAPTCAGSWCAAPTRHPRCAPRPQIIEESEEFLKAVSPQDQEKGYFPLKQVREGAGLPADCGWAGCCQSPPAAGHAYGAMALESGRQLPRALLATV